MTDAKTAVSALRLTSNDRNRYRQSAPKHAQPAWKRNLSERRYCHSYFRMQRRHHIPVGQSIRKDGSDSRGYIILGGYMARIPLLSENDPEASASVHSFLDGIKQKYGSIVDIARAMSNSVDSAKTFYEFLGAAYLDYRNLPPKQLELAFLTASVVNQCKYCIPTHTLIGRNIGLTERQMRHVADDRLPPNVYDPAEAAIVRFAQKSTRLEPIDDATYSDLAKYFTPCQIVDLSFAVGLSNMINRFVATFSLEVDEQTIIKLKESDPKSEAD